MSDLNAILEGQEDETTGEEVVESPSTEESETEGEVSTEGEAKEEEVPEPPKEEPKEDPAVAGLKAELARIREKLRKQETPEKPKEPEKLDFWTDPDKAINSLESRVEQKLVQHKLSWSEQAARGRHEDFDEKLETFHEMVKDNPALLQQMANDIDPAEFVYKAAATHQRLKEFGDLESFEAKIRAEERARIEADMNAKIEAEIQKRLKVPKSLSDARATGGNAPVNVNESLEDILQR